MKNKNIIQVFEYDKIEYDEFSFFEKKHFDSLVLFNQRNSNKYFDIEFKGLRFKNYVGVIQVGGLTIEILPKADRNSNPDKILWRDVLLQMLRICKRIQIDSVSETNLRKRPNSILEIYYEMFINEVDYLIKRGLIKKYRRQQNNLNALKGKIVFSRHLQQNLIHKEKFFCESQVYDRQHLIHQILFKALNSLKYLAPVYLKNKLNEVLFYFEDFTVDKITSSDFEKISLNRKSEPYKRAINIAKMIILNYSPSITSGKENMLTILFDMNELWEEYIYRILQQNKPLGFKVIFQDRNLFWESKSIVPDIVIEDNKGKISIVDTKWKVVENNEPSDEDLRQIFAYNMIWKAEKSLLLYPLLEQKEKGFGKYHSEYITEINGQQKKMENHCKVGFASVIENNDIKSGKKLADEIFRKLDQ